MLTRQANHLSPGDGKVVLTKHGNLAVFVENSSAYPLKLLTPCVNHDEVAVVYMTSYGGGLVSGDCVHLSVIVDKSAALVVLSQGSTKVFKNRPGQRLSAFSVSRTAKTVSATMQHLTFEAKESASIYLLPDPVTCFGSASYNQIQKFHLSSKASLVLLDWFTSGRKSRGEDWAFHRYYSCNEVWVDGTRIARDVTLLEDDLANDGSGYRKTLAEKLSPYSCYAMLILVGAEVQAIIKDISEAYKKISILRETQAPSLIWSLSAIPYFDMEGAVVRVAGCDTETVRKWLGEAMINLQYIVGVDVYRRAFPI